MKLCRTGDLNPMPLRLEAVVSDVKVVRSSVLLMRCCHGDGVVMEMVLMWSAVEMWSAVKFADCIRTQRRSTTS